MTRWIALLALTVSAQDKGPKEARSATPRLTAIVGAGYGSLLAVGANPNVRDEPKPGRR